MLKSKRHEGEKDRVRSNEVSSMVSCCVKIVCLETADDKMVEPTSLQDA